MNKGIKDIYTVGEVALLLGTTTANIYNRCALAQDNARHIHARSIGTKGRGKLIEHAEVERLLKAKK